MNNNPISIRCITDPKKGFGNFSRCLILAKELRKNDHPSIFIINKNKNVISILQKEGFQFKIIKKSKEYSKDYLNIKKILDYMNSSLLIIDMREFSENLSRNLRNQNFHTIIIDDAWVKNVYSDAIINGTIIKEYHNYNLINKNSKKFVGSKYFIANQKFKNNKKKISDIQNKNFFYIVISIGGSDPHNLTLFIVKSLISIPNIKILIIIGPFFSKLKKIENFVKKIKNISYIVSPPKIWKKFQKADLVISNAGNTLFELAIQKVPTACIATTNHEIPYAKAFSKKGFALNLGNWNTLDSTKTCHSIIKILSNVQKRRQMCQVGENIVDGKGYQRNIKIIEQYLKSKN